jgi:hypothetical protein
MVHPTEKHCILSSYAAPCWATGTRHRYPSKLPSATPYELSWTLLSCAAPYWSTLHPSELRCSLLSYARLCWATLHTAELRFTLLSYSSPFDPGFRIRIGMDPHYLHCWIRIHIWNVDPDPDLEEEITVHFNFGKKSHENALFELLFCSWKKEALEMISQEAIFKI